jgi:hypothetical protein
MKTWISTRESWHGLPWVRRLSWLSAVCIGALLLTLYWQVLQQGVARAEQFRSAPRMTTKAPMDHLLVSPR